MLAQYGRIAMQKRLGILLVVPALTLSSPSLGECQPQEHGAATLLGDEGCEMRAERFHVLQDDRTNVVKVEGELVWTCAHDGRKASVVLHNAEVRLTPAGRTNDAEFTITAETVEVR
jgi:hypothetical protein